jgi:toxin ParE1/3/4
MQCVFSPLAEFDLEEIGDYIARDNPARAVSFIRDIREKCIKITAMPEAAPLRHELGEGIRCKVTDPVISKNQSIDEFYS